MAKKKADKPWGFTLKNYEPTKFNITIDDDTEEDDIVLFKERKGHNERKDYYMWFMHIASLLGSYYYALSMEEFREIFNSRKGYHLDEDEMRIAAGEFIAFSTIQAADAYNNGDLDDPEDAIYCTALTDKRTGMEYLVCLDALDDEDLLDDYIRLKGNYPLYIPIPEEAEDVWENWWPKNTNRYVNKTIDGFVKKFRMDRDEAEEIVEDLWMTFALNGDPMEKLQGMADEYGLQVRDIKDVQALSDIVMELYNHTPQMGNNGYPPAELHERYQKDGRYGSEPPVIVPMSSLAAENMRKAGIPNVDYEASATTMPFWRMENGEITAGGKSKIYPNDPCPCGSGKKYKKCCGKAGTRI